MCDVDLNNGDSCSVWRNTWHKARKPRRCQACHTTIGAKERYMRHFDVFEGEVNVEYLCTVCGEAAEAFTTEHHGMSQSPAGIRHVLHECVQEDEKSQKRWQPVLDVIEARWMAARTK